MNPSEAVHFNQTQLLALRKLVAKGESQTLEFKRKAAHPEKIVKELIAFANSDGGVLLVGVDDNGTLAGVKYPEEEILAIQQAISLYCRPEVQLESVIIPLSTKNYIVRLDVSVSDRRPHYFKSNPGEKESFVRSGDKSVQASNEMVEIIRRSKLNKNIRFTFGEAEKTLMEYLEQKGFITLNEFRTLTRLNRFMASKKLVLLVLANVLRITPSEKGDTFTRR